MQKIWLFMAGQSLFFFGISGTVASLFTSDLLHQAPNLFVLAPFGIISAFGLFLILRCVLREK